MSKTNHDLIKNTPKRIGVFGGAFDPPHNAHVALAKAAWERFELNALHIIPTGQAWHKSRVLSAPEHRLAMTRLAFQDVPYMQVDDREIRRTGPSFTIDTLGAIQAENQQAQLYLLMGADQFSAFQQWNRWRDILDLAIICIADRAQSTVAKDQIDAQFDTYPDRSQRFLTLQLPLMPFSATQIRQMIASGSATTGEILQLVSGPVARYISLHRLYSSR